MNFIKIFNKNLNPDESQYIGSRIKSNTINLMSKGFDGEFYDKQIKYSEKMESGQSTCVTLTSKQLDYLMKDSIFSNIIKSNGLLD